MKFADLKITFATAAFYFFAAQSTLAATSSSSFPVNATISTGCSISSTAMSFGEVGTAGAATSQTDSTSSISITCTTGGGYTVALNAGLHAVGVQRNIESGSNVLAYDLYKDPARGTAWTDVAAPVVGTGTGVLQVITVYGRIAAGLPFSASNGTNFTDTVTITLTY